MRTETVLARAEFDEKLPHYWLLATLFTLLVTFIGIPVIPFWLIFGPRVHRKQYDVLECELTERTLNIRRGFLFRVEKNIPLDKIQDIGMTEGPLLRKLGLASLRIETAGNSVQGAADAQLVGIIDAPRFRDAILDQRDLVAGAPPTMEGKAPAGEGLGGEGTRALLVEIRDSLKRIEEGLRERP